jgi:hypothetical protein
LQKELASLKARFDILADGIEAATGQRFVRKGKTSAHSTTMTRGSMVTNIMESHPEFRGLRRVSPASYEKVKRLMKNCRTAEELEAALLELDNFKTYVVTPTTTTSDVNELVPYEALVDQVKELTEYVVKDMGRAERLVHIPTLPLDFNGVHDFRRGMAWEVLELVKNKGGTPAEHWEQLERDYKALKASGKGGSGAGGKRTERSTGKDDTGSSRSRATKMSRPTTTTTAAAPAKGSRPIAPFVAGPVRSDGAPPVAPPPQPLVVSGPTYEEYLVILQATKHLTGAESSQRFNELTFEYVAKRHGHEEASRYMRRMFPDFPIPTETPVAPTSPPPPPPMEMAQFSNEEMADLHPAPTVEFDNSALPGEMQFDAAEALTELGLHQAGLAFNNDFLADQFETDFPTGLTFNLQPIQQQHMAVAVVTPVPVCSATMVLESVAVMTVRADMELETLLVETVAAKSLGKIRVTLSKPAAATAVVFPTTTLPPRQQDGTVVLGAGRMIDGRKLFSHPQRQPTVVVAASGREDTDLDELIPVRSNYSAPIVIDIEDENEEDDDDSSSVVVSSSSASSLVERRLALKKLIAASSPAKSSAKKSKLVIEDEPQSSMSSVDTAPPAVAAAAAAAASKKKKKVAPASVPPKKNKAASVAAKKPAPAAEKKRTVDERPAHDDEEPEVVVAAVAAARAPRRRKTEKEMLEPWAFDSKRAEADKKFVFVVPSEAKAKQEFEQKKREREIQQRKGVWGRHI